MSYAAAIRTRGLSKDDGYEVRSLRSRDDDLEEIFLRYDAGHDPLGNGIELSDLAVLGAATAALMVIAMLGFRYRDLRA